MKGYCCESDMEYKSRLTWNYIDSRFKLDFNFYLCFFDPDNTILLLGRYSWNLSPGPRFRCCSGNLEAFKLFHLFILLRFRCYPGNLEAFKLFHLFILLRFRCCPGNIGAFKLFHLFFTFLHPKICPWSHNSKTSN